jgi:hypothetical protein
MFVQCSARDGAPVSLRNITSEGEDKKKVEESTSEPMKAEYVDEEQRRLIVEQRQNNLFDAEASKCVMARWLGSALKDLARKGQDKVKLREIHARDRRGKNAPDGMLGFGEAFLGFISARTYLLAPAG